MQPYATGSVSLGSAEESYDPDMTHSYRLTEGRLIRYPLIRYRSTRNWRETMLCKTTLSDDLCGWSMNVCPKGGYHDPEDMEVNEDGEDIIAVCSKCGNCICFPVFWSDTPDLWEEGCCPRG